MAKEVLAIPEHKLAEVIAVIREGLFGVLYKPYVSDETRDMLRKWCNEQQTYLNRLASPDQ